MDPASSEFRTSGQYQDSHRSPGRSSIQSPQGSRTVSQALPMNINNGKREEAPPPLPPPRIVDGPDLAYKFANMHSNPGLQVLNIPASSSLHGGRMDIQESAPGIERKGSYSSRAFPSLDVFQLSNSDEGYVSIPGSGNNQLQRDVPMEARNRKDSSHAYDQQLVSKLGRPKTPTQSASIGSQEGSPTSRRQSLQSTKPQLKNLSLSDRSLSLSSDPVFTPSFGSSKWASSPQSQSGSLMSPGFISSAASHRSPTREGSNVTSPGALSGSHDEAERFMRRTVAQPPAVQRSDSSLSIGLIAAGALGGRNEEPGGTASLPAGRANRSRAARHQTFQVSEDQREQQTQQGVDERRLQFLNLKLDDRSNSSHHHTYSQQQQQHQQQRAPPPLTPSASHPSLPIHTNPHSHTHLGAQPQPASSHLAGFVPHTHHPTLIAPQPSSSTHAQQQHFPSPAQSRQGVSQSRPGMPPSKRKHEEEDNTDDDRGAAGAQRRTSSQHHRRTSPAHPPQASYSSASSVGLSNGSYASSTGISIGNSSLTSISSISPRERLSPSQLPPSNDQGDNRNSPRMNSLSLDPAMRASSSQSQSQPHSQSQSQPQPQSQPHPQSQPTSLAPPQHSLSSADAQATAAAAHNMASDHSSRQQQQANAPQLQANLHICDCCPKKPKKFDTLEELRQHQAEKQYYCQYCHNRFKNKNEAERHQNSLHLRRHSWSCATLDRNYHTAFHPCTAIPPNTSATHSQMQQAQQAQQAQYAEYDVCGYCGERFTNHPVDWVVRSQHLTTVHKFGECNQSKKFYRADHFRQHLKHSHGGQSGKWTNMLENACMREEPPLTPDSQGQDQIRTAQHPTQSQHVPPQPTEAQLQAQQAAAAAQAAARAAQAAQAATDQQQHNVKPEQPQQSQQLMSQYDAAALQSAPVAVMGSSGPYPPMTTSIPPDVKYQTIKEDR